MKKFRSILSLILALTLILCGGVVFAEETPAATEEVVQIDPEIQAKRPCQARI